MKPGLIVGLWMAFLPCAECWAEAVLEQATRLEQQGDFKQAAAVLVRALVDPRLSSDRRLEYEFELDRLDRIKKDYPLTEDQLFSELEKSVSRPTRDEFQRWLAEGRFDSRSIDGQRFFMGESVPNLFFRYSDLSPRRLPVRDTTALQERQWRTCVAIKRAALAEKTPYVLPEQFEVTMTVTAKANSVPDGQLVRAWLPIPRHYPFQTDFKLIAASPAVEHIDAPDSPIRSIYLAQPARTNTPTRFTIQYQYTMRGVWFDVRPEQVRSADLGNPELQKFTCEGPHIVFTPQMRAMSDQLAGGEANPYRRAKKFYDWIAEHIQYSYAVEYSTIRNISEYCRQKGYGDCGQQALLFITLCRLNGIPARWQSGWSTCPGAKTMHDWTEVYFAPHGWIPVDPYMGIYAMRYATSLTTEQRRELRDFYFGGLDQYRMAANSDHSQPLNPPKQSIRSDNVDFQRGELEWGNHNLYFDQFTYELTMRPVSERHRLSGH